MINPCRECDLKDQDKNNPTCMSCSKRVAYCSAIGGLSYSVIENVTLDGQGRGKTMTEKQTEFKATKICSRADCEHYGMSQLLAEFDTNNKVKDGKQAHCKSCRRKIQKARLSRLAGAPATPSARSVAVQKTALARANKPDPDPAPAPKLDHVIIPADNRLIIDFAEHPNVLKKIEEIALEEIRTPSAQALYVLKLYALRSEIQAVNAD